jgi:hypothetical protein
MVLTWFPSLIHKEYTGQNPVKRNFKRTGKKRVIAQKPAQFWFFLMPGYGNAGENNLTG